MRCSKCRTPGLSPRVRGNPNENPVHDNYAGSIPACAGEPIRCAAILGGRGVYPRVCGGTSRPGRRRHLRRGLSPRVRGNPLASGAEPGQRRSIPACAGEPLQWRRWGRQHPVYPRVCGGTACTSAPTLSSVGLSPRVRGNRRLGVARGPDVGSIPACAGEPRKGYQERAPPAVYPRVCGGTAILLRLLRNTRGLSPRVRGNRARQASARAAYRSIPACAGEPPCRHCRHRRERVYPRVCGGTPTEREAETLAGGLSPRVRGNRRWPDRRPRMPGSIPACAGEPLSPMPTSSTATVYPRVCGGTDGIQGWETGARGLSPRVRGNPPPLFRPLVRVYPRVCGGTSVSPSGASFTTGLSPRVRGNRGQARHSGIRPGSIPACAGEPVGYGPPQYGGRVYPRVCGGTILSPYAATDL